MNPQETPDHVDAITDAQTVDDPDAITDAQTVDDTTDPPSILNPTANNQDGSTAGMTSFSGSLGNSYNSSFGQPPSESAVRPIVVSQPSGTGNSDVYDQPPSLNDAGRREGSQTGPSLTGHSDAVAEPGMSLPAHRFKKHYPNAFQKDDKNN
ncbi:hypothetical protein R6Q59_035171 [Mikania micrantha]